MQVTVIDVYPKYSLVEYEEDGYIQRKEIPQELHHITSRGPVTLPDDVVQLGMEYSNVDLVQALGEELPSIRVRDLEDQLRRAGVWTQQDYKDRPGVVAGVYNRMRGVDVTTILNAAFQRIGE